MHLHAKPYAKIAIHERTEPFSLRLKNWAKDVEVGSRAPFRGIDDHMWYAVKYDDNLVTIHWTSCKWKGIAEAVEEFDATFLHGEKRHVCNVPI